MERDGRMTTDKVEELVANAINSILKGSDDDVAAAFDNLATIDAAEVVGELFLWVEDVTEGVDLNSLLDAARIPLPDHAVEIVNAILARDMKGLEAVTSRDDLGVAVEAILGVIVSLKDARGQIPS